MNYFDYAAATPVDERVFEAMKPYYSERFYNPSSVYLASRAIKQDITKARESVAHWLGSKPSEIIFTAGATEANNIVIQGIQAAYKDSKIALSAIEHEAVLEPTSNAIILPVNKYGQVEPETLKDHVTDEVALVSILYANNEVGTVQHMRQLANSIVELRKDRIKRGIEIPLYFHSDASQAPNYLDLHTSKLGVDFMTLNGGKIYGPKQTGVLFCRAGIVLPSFIQGGGQEKGIRSGTENVAGIIGFTKALSIAQKQRRDETNRLGILRKKIINTLSDIEGVTLLGHQKQTIPNIISALIDGVDGERLVMMLDERGFQVSTGSACSALKDDSSHVIKALGYSEEQAQTSLRISMGRPTTEAEVMALCDILPETILEARSI